MREVNYYNASNRHRYMRLLQSATALGKKFSLVPALPPPWVQQQVRALATAPLEQQLQRPAWIAAGFSWSHKPPVQQRRLYRSENMGRKPLPHRLYSLKIMSRLKNSNRGPYPINCFRLHSLQVDDSWTRNLLMMPALETPHVGRALFRCLTLKE